MENSSAIFDGRIFPIVGVGFLGGIGFTMSIFITLRAFLDPVTPTHQPQITL